MNRTAYIASVKAIEQFLDEQDALGSALQKHLCIEEPKPLVTFGHKLLETFMDVVEEASGDTVRHGTADSWLRWYIWNARGKGMECIVGGRTYFVSTPSDLWRVLCAWKQIENGA